MQCIKDVYMEGYEDSPALQGGLGGVLLQKSREKSRIHTILSEKTVKQM